MRPSLDIANVHSRCPREAAPLGQGARSCESQLAAAHAAGRQVAAGRRRPPGARSPPYSTVTDLARFLGWSTSQPRRIATSRARSCSGTVAVMALKASRTLGTQMT